MVESAPQFVEDYQTPEASKAATQHLYSTDRHRVVMASIATTIATLVGGIAGWHIGKFGAKKDAQFASRFVAGLLGVTSGGLALDANLREPSPVVSIAEESRRKEQEALHAAEPTGMTDTPRAQIHADSVLHMHTTHAQHAMPVR